MTALEGLASIIPYVWFSFLYLHVHSYNEVANNLLGLGLPNTWIKQMLVVGETSKYEYQRIHFPAALCPRRYLLQSDGRGAPKFSRMKWGSAIDKIELKGFTCNLLFPKLKALSVWRLLRKQMKYSKWKCKSNRAEVCLIISLFYCRFRFSRRDESKKVFLKVKN